VGFLKGLILMDSNLVNEPNVNSTLQMLYNTKAALMIDLRKTPANPDAIAILQEIDSTIKITESSIVKHVPCSEAVREPCLFIYK